MCPEMAPATSPVTTPAPVAPWEVVASTQSFQSSCAFPRVKVAHLVGNGTFRSSFYLPAGGTLECVSAGVELESLLIVLIKCPKSMG
jgi:hypothetical protein